MSINAFYYCFLIVFISAKISRLFFYFQISCFDCPLLNKCLQLSMFKAKDYRYFISLEFCELIRERCDEFLSSILHALFFTVILIYSLLHVLFSFNLKNFSIFLIFSSLPNCPVGATVAVDKCVNSSFYFLVFMAFYGLLRLGPLKCLM